MGKRTHKQFICSSYWIYTNIGAQHCEAWALRSATKDMRLFNAWLWGLYMPMAPDTVMQLLSCTGKGAQKTQKQKHCSKEYNFLCMLNMLKQLNPHSTPDLCQWGSAKTVSPQAVLQVLQTNAWIEEQLVLKRASYLECKMLVNLICPFANVLQAKIEDLVVHVGSEPKLIKFCGCWIKQALKRNRNKWGQLASLPIFSVNISHALLFYARTSGWGPNPGWCKSASHHPVPPVELGELLASPDLAGRKQGAD